MSRSNQVNQHDKRKDLAERVKVIKAQQDKWMKEKRSSTQSPKVATHQNTEELPARTISDSSMFTEASPRYNPALYKSSSMSVKDFSSKADEIINRVKYQLNVSRDRPGGDMEGFSTQSSAHTCSNCQKLMVSTSHLPIMLIPCGHSFCQTCCEDLEFCYACSVEVTSQTNNVMLEQVIKSSHTSRPAAKRIPTELNPDERQNLMMRKEALEEEQQNIATDSQSIRADIQEEVRQIEKIEQEEGRLLRQIAKLQKEMSGLQAHKEEYRDRIQSHQHRISANQSKADLIGQTLRDINSRISSLR